MCQRVVIFYCKGLYSANINKLIQYLFHSFLIKSVIIKSTISNY